jgi:hypothetical protein
VAKGPCLKIDDRCLGRHRAGNGEAPAVDPGNDRLRTRDGCQPGGHGAECHAAAGFAEPGQDLVQVLHRDDAEGDRASLGLLPRQAAQQVVPVGQAGHLVDIGEGFENSVETGQRTHGIGHQLAGLVAEVGRQGRQSPVRDIGVHRLTRHQDRPQQTVQQKQGDRRAEQRRDQRDADDRQCREKILSLQGEEHDQRQERHWVPRKAMSIILLR